MEFRVNPDKKKSYMVYVDENYVGMSVTYNSSSKLWNIEKGCSLVCCIKGIDAAKAEVVNILLYEKLYKPDLDKNSRTKLDRIWEKLNMDTKDWLQKEERRQGLEDALKAAERRRPIVYGYARVSTRTQIKGNSLEDQRRTLVAEGCETIFEEQYTGATTTRPELEKLLLVLKAGDTLTVTKLDRLARNVTEGLELVKMLVEERGVKVKALNAGGIIDNSPTGKILLTMLFAFAEWERSLIIERTQAGKEIARTKNGYREGRPPINQDKITAALDKINRDNCTVKEAAKAFGISEATLYRAKRKMIVDQVV